MAHETLERVEAMLVSLRDQLDRLSEHVESGLGAQGRMLTRLEAEVVELGLELRAAALDATEPRDAAEPVRALIRLAVPRVS